MSGGGPRPFAGEQGAHEDERRNLLRRGVEDVAVQQRALAQLTFHFPEINLVFPAPRLVARKDLNRPAGLFADIHRV